MEVGKDADVVAGAFEGEVSDGGAGASGGVGDDFVHAPDADVAELAGEVVVGAEEVVVVAEKVGPGEVGCGWGRDTRPGSAQPWVPAFAGMTRR